MSTITNFNSLVEVAQHFRKDLTGDHRPEKDLILFFAHNGTGKTRLSMDFKQLGKEFDAEGNVTKRDTLYFNAFTEDLFSWHNDFENDTNRFLQLNADSAFFEGLKELNLNSKIESFYTIYTDIKFNINYEDATVAFSRSIVVDQNEQTVDNIKISRGEETLFIWCFSLAICQLVIDKDPAYSWVKYIYIDDPISSLDENNAIAVAHHLAKMLKVENSRIQTIISTHHSLFYNVLCNEFKNSTKYFLRKKETIYQLSNTTDTPFLYHVFVIQEIQKAINENKLLNYHFTILRNLLEKTANFHGFDGFENLIVINDDDDEKTLYHRYVQIFNHGGYSLFEPTEMTEDNKVRFAEIFENFKRNYKFNNALFPEITT